MERVVVAKCSPYLDLPCRSLESALAKREAKGRAVTCEKASVTTGLIEDAVRIKARLAAMNLPIFIGLPLYVMSKR